MRRNEKKERKQTRSGIILNLRFFCTKNWRPAFSPAGRWTFSFNLGVGEEFDKLLHEGRHWRGLRVSCRAADESRNVGQLVCRSRYPSSSSFFLVCALEAVDLIRSAWAIRRSTATALQSLLASTWPSSPRSAAAWQSQRFWLRWPPTNRRDSKCRKRAAVKLSSSWKKEPKERLSEASSIASKPPMPTVTPSSSDFWARPLTSCSASSPSATTKLISS